MGMKNPICLRKPNLHTEMKIKGQDKLTVSALSAAGASSFTVSGLAAAAAASKAA
jgi:hypothetical protein